VLEWQLKNSKKFKHLEAFIKQKEAGLRVPFLDNVPEIHPHNRWIMRGYELLSSQRLKDQQRPQPIQISEIAAYVAFVGTMDEADREDFMRIVCKLDGITMDFVQSQINAENRKQRTKSGKKGGR